MGFWDSLENLGGQILDSAGKVVDSVASGVGSSIQNEKDEESKSINTDTTNKSDLSGPEASNGVMSWVRANTKMLLVAAVGITGLIVVYKTMR